MKPNHDDASEDEAPMTRALFATDVDESAQRSAVDLERTLEKETCEAPSETDVELSKLGKPANPALTEDSLSAWSNNGSRRGIAGKIEPGQILYSKYLVLRKIGNGAMGEVWLVRHVTMKSEHALKVIIPNFASNPVALMRFQRELEIMASLRQEHAVTIFDAFMDENGGYIDMEYLDGLTIHEVLQASKNRPDFRPSEPLMPLDWIVRILDQLCEVLQIAHAKGIVHRDLKPSNMMLLNGKRPGKESLKVLDFGIAKIRDDPDSAAVRDQEDDSNKTQGFIGTPSYASPEQAMARKDIDGRSDLYSVGIMLYEFITGRLPFRGNHWQVMNQHANTPPPPFSEANPDLRPLPELEHAVLRVLSKDPNQRPATAINLFNEVREAVEAVMPAGSPSLSPATWSAVRYRSSSSGSVTAHPTLFPTEHESQFGKEPVSTQAKTVMAEATHAEPSKFVGGSPSDLGLVIADRRVKPRTKVALIVALVLASVFVVVGLIAFKNRPVPIKPPETKTRSLTFERYWPSDYLAAEDTSADQVWPEKVRRTTDQVFFLRFADGIYLPEGFAVENPTDLVDGWPRVILRDGVRFLRIQGDKEWVMGAWDAPVNSGRTDTPAHAVILNGYYLQETEVTNGQFEDYLRKTETPRPVDWDRVMIELRRKELEEAKNHPAVSLSHKEAQLYARYMSGQLPTEAQWEFAARSRGDKRRYVWGNDPSPTRELANIDSQGITTAPVRSYPNDKTAQGLFDMTGNVKEMCRDRWTPYMETLKPVRDPCTLPESSEVVDFAIRGAAYDLYGAACATTRRDDHRPASELAENVGFRLVIECPDTRKPR